MKVHKGCTINFAFILVGTIRLEGLAIYVGDDYFAFILVDTIRLEGLAIYAAADYFAFILVNIVQLEGSVMTTPHGLVLLHVTEGDAWSTKTILGFADTSTINFGMVKFYLWPSYYC
jgi:hypothetical protein